MNVMTPQMDMKNTSRPLRLGFLGTGWIGRHRMKAILDTGLATAAAIADPSPEMAAAALQLAPEARYIEDVDRLIEEDLDGIVIATPSAAHAEQSIMALKKGKAVFCQKPLGRSAEEVRAVVEAARTADRLLGVDLSYRHTAAVRAIRQLIDTNALGSVFAVDLTFHNAYGPDKPWFYDRTLSGGGCVIDLGVHMVDLALWSLGFPKVAAVSSHLMKDGQPLAPEDVEDFAVATLTLETGAVLRLACSWKLQAGCDAVIGASFYGREGGAGFRNVDGSFYDFTSERYAGTNVETLTRAPDDWGGRAAADWVRRLSQGDRFDPAAEQFIVVADVLDRIYAGR
ncbi:Gfo/Idh/MocA family oxidoreductase [Rhizobium sp. NFR03]|uniref:Gfo/Idh/MocA family protein n=1 Tax=Rhizobium sp. NFR03 TaxID=1566263 RepID=UPI0008C8A726|nr:Gfo/Idh/MocA family oxidoreductase [Rhizobium sp. NFR03]SER68296.1 Predicted dehydrogenase [Rhizobium sp. NFR03]